MRTSTRRWSTSSALALVALLAAPPARADQHDVESYRSALARGAERFEDGDYAAARRAFQLAYAIHPEPVLLFNIASTHRRQGNRPLALRYYRRFLEEASDDDSRRALALKTIAELEEELAAPPEPPEPPPRRTATRRLRVLSPVAPPRVEHRGRALRWTGVAFGLAGAGALGLAWASARDARAAESSLEDLPSDQAWDDEQAETYRDGRAASRRALLFGIAGGALATTGVVLFAIGHHRAGEVALAPSSGGGAVVMSGRF